MALVIIRFALRIHVLLVVTVTVAGSVTAAIGSILLITSVVDTTYHVKLEPIDIALWVIPTAIGPR